ncbi:putative autophagy protein [Erysiphe necator]|uniref:Putative autophagy protein n=1 Tax=Uncinula necator TaxID=52586 RepID=A0A0B1NZB7_UNCNE|nr:putative autophagy protein [Erysiphe necator]
MGWFWSQQDCDSGSDKDPLRNLDPSLREFLKKESPVKYYNKENSFSKESPSLSLASKSTTSTSKSSEVPLNLASEGASSNQHNASEDNESRTFSNSSPSTSSLPLVYKDGRYNHLWKSYQSPEEVDRHMKSDQEKIDEILEGFKYRRAEIGKAALENCALEQAALSDCWTHGSAKARLMLCREENKAFNRCHTMQSKFLKALGYLSTFDRPAVVDEEIQMYADTLYHRMLEEEKLIEAANAKGEPKPKFPPLLSHTPSFSLDSGDQKALQDVEKETCLPSDLKSSVRKQLKTRLEELTDIEREVEEQAIKAEIRAGESLGRNLADIYEKQKEERKARKEKGKETIGDKVISIFGFGKL